MTKKTAKLLDAARELPEKDRLQLVEELLFDLDGPAPLRSTSELQAIIDRRTDEVRAGKVKPLSVDEVKALRARRRGK